MELHPDYIKENLEHIGKKEALVLLKEWINSSSDPKLRQNALINFGLIDEGKNFKFFEDLFLSDEDIKIRLIAGKILKENYLQNKRLIPLLDYTLNKLDRVELQLFAIKTLNSIKNVKSRKILIEYLKTFIKKEHILGIQDLLKEILNFNYNEAIPESILDIFFNLILNEHYTKKYGYHVTLRNGKIISLNCESVNLNRITEIKGLENLHNLEHLQLERNNLANIDGIQKLKKLKSLNLSFNKLVKIEKLEHLKNLEEVHLSNNKISKIENLDSLINLKKLFLNGNFIEKIENLTTLINLEELNLGHNKIVEIKNLNTLKQLKRLNLSFNQIKKIEGFNTLKDLMWLYLNDNEITQITGLTSLLNLKGLYLSNNLIEWIEGIDSLVNLKKIELSNNKIFKITGLNALRNLQELYLDNNNIQRIEELANLESLIMLHLGRNKISHYRNEYVESLKNLNFLFLNENPLDQESWRQFRERFKYP
ncbi:MAG: leucine-rich repeat protein [Promethearchaeota archaeon]